MDWREKKYRWNGDNCKNEAFHKVHYLACVVRTGRSGMTKWVGYVCNMVEETRKA